MTGFETLKRSHRKNASALARTWLPTLGLVLMLFAFGLRNANADISFPSTIPKTSDALTAIVNVIPGLEKAGISNFLASDNSASADLTIRGQQVSVAAIKPSGVAKVILVIAPKSFKLSSFLPVPSGTPADGVKFNDIVLIVVPKGAARKGVSISGLPTPIHKSLSHVGTQVNLNEGLNLFGQADVSSSGTIKQVLSAVGHDQFALPLKGVFSTDVFKYDPKTASQKLKEELLAGLNLKLPLPQLTIPGMPDIVKVNKAHLAIISREVEGKSKIFAGVTGNVDIKVSSKDTKFTFGILAGDPGKQWQATITGSSEDKITLPFFKPLALSNMSWTAKRESGKWDVSIDAKTTLNNKEVDIALTHEPEEGFSAEIKGKFKLADLLPSGASIPGVTDVEFDDLQINKEFVQVQGKVKGLDTIVTAFKLNSKTYLAINNPKTIKISSLITAAKGTPLDDASFDDMSYIWAPKGGEEHGLEVSALPPAIAENLEKLTDKVSLKEGLNVIGQMSITETSSIGKLLNDVGIHKDTLPLKGQLSTNLFHPGNTSTIKNEVLDQLNFNIKLPPLKIPDIDKFLTFNNGHLRIAGKTPDGKRGIDVAVSGEADLLVKDNKVAFIMDVEYQKSGGSNEFTFNGVSKEKWTHPLGINFLDLDNLTVAIDKKKGAFDVSMAAKTDIGSHSALDVSIDVHEANGKITDAFFELDGPLKLSEIPHLNKVPSASHFTIDTIKVSEHGVEAKTDFGNSKDLDVFLFASSGWNLILRQDNFTITEIVPPLKNTPLKHIVLSEAALVLSKNGLKGALSSFSPIAQDALADIYGEGATNIDVGSGINLISAFEHKKSKGGLSDALSRLGLSEERVIMTGDIGGMFGGPAKLNIDVDLSAHTGAKKQPKWMKSKPGVTAVFSLIATESDGQFDIEIGIGADITAKVHGTELDFTAKAALEFQDEKIDIKIVADLKDDKGWHKPFGIPGFTMYEVGFDLGIVEDGAIHLGFDGSIKVSGKHYAIAAAADLLPEALGAPQDIAFIGSADQVDMFFMEEIAIAMMGAKFKLDIPGGILPNFTDVKFAFVTPGGSDPDLNIPGDDSPLKGSEGFALQGAMNWLDHELGDMKVAISPENGILADAKIDDFDLGPLHLKNNDFYLKAGLKDVPTLKVDSDLNFIGIEERFKFAFDKTGVSLDVTQKFGPDFSMTANMKLSGIDISATKPSFKDADFYMEGDFTLDIGKFIAGPATDALNDVFDTLSAGFKAAETAVAKAQKNVNGLTTKINTERAKVRKEKAAAEAKVQNAENRVNSLNSTVKDQWSSYHKCHGWGKWPCEVSWGVRIGFTKGEIIIADAALELVKKLIDHFPIDLDPRVALLIAERDTAREALYVVQEALKGADAIDKFLKEATDKLTNNLKNSININKAQFKGDLKGIIEHDNPVDLAIDAEFFGAKVKDTFAFQIGNIAKDLVKDVEKLGLMGVYALHHLVEEGISEIPGPLKNKLRSAITKKLEAKHAANKRDLAQHKTEFNKYNLAAKAIKEHNKAYGAAYILSQLAENKSSLDTETTETFTNELIEVGHTGLCLDDVNGKVKQDRCADEDAERWSTKAVSGAPHTVANGGYVNIVQPKSGNCIVPEGTWSTVEKTYSDPDMPKEGSFTFQQLTFSGDGNISVETCANSKEFYWKVLKHGDGWMQMANLATNKCLHFEDSNSIPGGSEAGWKSCIGSANQVYRVADTATPVYHADNIALRNDQLGLCVGAADDKGVVSMSACDKASRFDYLVDVRGYVKFINTATGNCLQPSGYKTGASMIEVACTQLDYQWWDANSQPGGIIIKNAQTTLCTDPPFTIDDASPSQVDCEDRHNAVFAPVINKDSGPLWKLVSAETLPAKSGRFDAGKGLNVCSFNFNGSFVPGVVDNGIADLGLGHKKATNVCTIYSDGVYNKAEDKYRLAVSGSGMEWQKSNGKLHWSYIPTGGFGGDTPQTIYTCKATPSVEGLNIKTPSIGWTVDGNSCFLAYSVESIVTDFEVLARTKDSYYQLKLGKSGTEVSYSADATISAEEAKTRETWVDAKVKESKAREAKTKQGKEKKALKQGGKAIKKGEDKAKKAYCKYSRRC